MNITIDELNTAYEKLQQPLSPAEREQEEQTVARIVTEEKKYLERCAVNLCSNVKPIGSLSQLRDEANRTLSLGTTEQLACSLSDKLLLITQEKSVDVIDKRKVTDIKRIGKESVMGNVYRGKIDGVDRVFVFKLSNFKREGNDLMIHELVAGMNLNELRAQGIPNFCFTYGSFSCGPLTENKETNTLSICGAGDPVTYVMYEDLGESIASNEYLETATPEQALSLILQVAMGISSANTYFSSLKGAKERYPFTHYDLHSQNVMIRRTDDNVFQIPYFSSKRETFYITADSIATIIDYGSVYVNGYGEPMTNIKRNGQSNTKGFPIHDIFKFVCSLSAGYSGNVSGVKRILATALEFFTNENLDTFLKGVQRHYFSLPILERLEKYTVENFINHLVSSIYSYNPTFLNRVYSSSLMKVIPLINTHRTFQQIPITYTKVEQERPPSSIPRRVPISETLSTKRDENNRRNERLTNKQEKLPSSNNLPEPVDPIVKSTEKLKKRGSYIASKTGTIVRKNSNILNK